MLEKQPLPLINEDEFRLQEQVSLAPKLVRSDKLNRKIYAHNIHPAGYTQRALRTQDGRISIIKAEHHRQLQAAWGQDTVAKQLFPGLDVTHTPSPNHAGHVRDILHWGFNKKAANKFPVLSSSNTKDFDSVILTSSPLSKTYRPSVVGSDIWLDQFVDHGINIDIRVKEMCNIDTGADN